MFNASIYTNDLSFNQNEIENWTHTADVFFKETRVDVECEASLLFLPFFIFFFLSFFFLDWKRSCLVVLMYVIADEGPARVFLVPMNTFSDPMTS